MTKKSKKETKYTIQDGHLCIQHYLLLQQLTYRKKLKTGEYKQYNSYHIKFPRVVHDLIDPPDDTIYLEKVEDEIIIHKEKNEKYKKVRFQKNNKTDTHNITYQLTIPKKMLKIDNYKRGETYILCQVTAAENNEGYSVTLIVGGR